VHGFAMKLFKWQQQQQQQKNAVKLPSEQALLFPLFNLMACCRRPTLHAVIGSMADHTQSEGERLISGMTKDKTNKRVTKADMG
jgi:hypothetical protein